MPKDYIDIGSTPAEEDCQQLGTPNYDHTKSREECRVFIEQLRRQFGDEPTGARLSIKSNPHDFGTYLEVVCYYDTDNEEACNYAFNCESECPAKWDDQALIRLGLVDRLV